MEYRIFNWLMYVVMIGVAVGIAASVAEYMIERVVRAYRGIRYVLSSDDGEGQDQVKE